MIWVDDFLVVIWRLISAFLPFPVLSCRTWRLGMIWLADDRLTLLRERMDDGRLDGAL